MKHCKKTPLRMHQVHRAGSVVLRRGRLVFAVAPPGLYRRVRAMGPLICTRGPHRTAVYYAEETHLAEQAALRRQMRSPKTRAVATRELRDMLWYAYDLGVMTRLRWLAVPDFFWLRGKKRLDRLVLVEQSDRLVLWPAKEYYAQRSKR